MKLKRRTLFSMVAGSFFPPVAKAITTPAPRLAPTMPCLQFIHTAADELYTLVMPGIIVVRSDGQVTSGWSIIKGNSSTPLAGFNIINCNGDYEWRALPCQIHEGEQLVAR